MNYTIFLDDPCRIAELDEELAHSDHHIDDLEARITTLEKENDQLQLQVKDLTDIVDAASIASRLAAEQKQELIEKYTQQINDLETELQRSLSDAESRIQDSSSANSSLEHEKTKLAEELAAALSIISSLETKNHELIQDKENLEDSLQLNETRESELLVELSTLREKYDAMKNSETEVQKLLEIAKDRVIQAELTAQRNQEAYDAASREVLVLGEQIERIKWRSKEEIDEWSNRISQLEKELEAAHAEAIVTKELLSKEHETQVLSTITQLQQEINHLKELLSAAEGQGQELSKQLRDKNDEIVILQEKVSTQNSVLMKQIETLEQELAHQTSKVLPELSQELQDRTASCHSQALLIETIQTELREKNSQKQQLEDQYSILEKELMRNRQEFQSLSQRNVELEESFSNSNSIQQQSINQSLERALQDLREERERFDNYRTKRDEESLALHKQMISSQEKLEAIQKQNREMAENLEMERKNRNAILHDAQQELQETKKQLNEALKKLSHSSSRRHSRSYDDDDVFGTDDEGDSGELDHAAIVKYHRDLAVARAEIADLAQQLVESAHREDDMQQCITDLQQEISIIMSHMTQFQQQLLLQGQATSLRQSTSTLLSERNGSTPSKASGSNGYEMLPNYELIEKYKQLYNETLERCQNLENEIIEEKELMNQKVYLSTSSLHDEIHKYQHENIELKRELYEMKQQLQVHKESLLKRKTSEIHSATASSNEMIEKYKGMYLQTLERCQSLENEVIHEKEENSRKYLAVIDELTEELTLLKDENINVQNEVQRLENLLKIASQENEILKGNETMRSKELQDAQQQLKFIKSTFQDIAKPLNRLLSQDEQPTGE